MRVGDEDNPLGGRQVDVGLLGDKLSSEINSAMEKLSSRVLEMRPTWRSSPTCALLNMANFSSLGFLKGEVGTLNNNIREDDGFVERAEMQQLLTDAIQAAVQSPANYIERTLSEVAQRIESLERMTGTADTTETG